MGESPVIALLIIATCAVSLVAFQRPDIEHQYLFSPERILADKEYYRLFTSAFLHAGWGHLLLNMYALYGIGSAIAWTFGSGGFLQIYFCSIVGGNLLSLFIHRHHEYSAYGASGGVCGVLFAYVLRFPSSPMMLFPLPYAIPAWLYAIAFMIASFFALKAQRDNIGHDAHLGGAIIGLLVAAGLQPETVRHHWVMFTSLLFVATLALTCLVYNPMFLPLSAWVEIPSWRDKRRSRPAQARRDRAQASLRPARPESATKSERTVLAQDWLIREIEVQIGPLHKDPNGRHDWIDKFGRTYDVITSQADHFHLASFTQTVRERLLDPNVHFLIVDTRNLHENQVALLRPFFADLPDDQFKRVLRSYAFKEK